jgi:protein SCO1
MKYLFSIVLLVAIFSCKNVERADLPILGERDMINGDTAYHTIPDFSFMDQDSNMVTNATYKDKIYVVDFFFTSCPTICPKVTAQMLRLYDKYKDNDQIMLLSHTIDVKHDTIPKLKFYADKLNVKAPKWRFVTGAKDSIYRIANDYFSVAKEDPNTPGGFDHSGRLILVDSKKMVRAFCDGTDEVDVTRFMEDIDFLLSKKVK